MPPYLQLVLGGLLPFLFACALWAAAACVASRRFPAGDWACWALPAITYNAALHVAAVLVALWIDYALPDRLHPALYAEGLVITSAAALVASLGDSSPFPLYGGCPRSPLACAALKAGFLTPWAYVLTATPVNLFGLKAHQLFLLLAGGGAALTWLGRRWASRPQRCSH